MYMYCIFKIQSLVSIYKYVPFQDYLRQKNPRWQSFVAQPVRFNVFITCQERQATQTTPLTMWDTEKKMWKNSKSNYYINSPATRTKAVVTIHKRILSSCFDAVNVTACAWCWLWLCLFLRHFSSYLLCTTCLKKTHGMCISSVAND